MSIKVRFFASLGERLGRSGLDLDFAQTMTVRDVWQCGAAGNTIPDNVLAAVNMEYADLDSLVHDGDEVAFFPPVTGG
jgi:molybdopterin synthase sulfur carrier subunit